MESGGITTLTTLLHSRNTRLVQEAVTALSYIVSDSEDNKHAVIADRGLEDLAFAAKNGSDVTRRYVAGIFLDLAFSTEIRAQMASMLTPSKQLFSSPEPKAQVSYSIAVRFRPSSIVRRPSSVNFLHFHLLLENAWLDFNQTWQESSLGVGDSKLFKSYVWPPWGPRGRAPKGQTMQIQTSSSPDPEGEWSSYVVCRYLIR